MRPRRLVSLFNEDRLRSANIVAVSHPIAVRSAVCGTEVCKCPARHRHRFLPHSWHSARDFDPIASYDTGYFRPALPQPACALRLFFLLFTSADQEHLRIYVYLRSNQRTIAAHISRLPKTFLFKK